MLSASSPLLVLLLTVLQLVLFVDAKGGGKGSKGSKSTKKKYKSKPKHVYKENGKCYDEKYIPSFSCLYPSHRHSIGPKSRSRVLARQTPPSSLGSSPELLAVISPFIHGFSRTES